MSRDLLERVVVACHLWEPKNKWSIAGMKLQFLKLVHLAPDQKTAIYNAVVNLEQALQVQILPSSDLIKVTYASSSPTGSADVLEKLSTFYIEKNASIHRPTGTFEFFQQQAQEYEKNLAAAEARLVEFNRQKGVVSADVEKQIQLQKMNEFDTSLKQTQGSDGGHRTAGSRTLCPDWHCRSSRYNSGQDGGRFPAVGQSEDDTAHP